MNVSGEDSAVCAGVRSPGLGWQCSLGVTGTQNITETMDADAILGSVLNKKKKVWT